MKFTYCIALLALTIISQNSNALPQLRIIAVNEAPANYLDNTGQPTGYVTDIVLTLAEQLEHESNIEFVPEARSLSILEQNKNVILFSISQTPKRQDKYLWIGKVLEKSSYIYTLNRRQLKFNAISELQSLDIIGVVRGDIREKWLIDAGLSNLQSVTQHKQNLGLLLKERIDAMAYENIGLFKLLKDIDTPYHTIRPSYLLRSSSVYIVMSKQSDQTLFKNWQAAFEKIKVNGELATISLKWQDIIKNEVGVKPLINEDILVF